MLCQNAARHKQNKSQNRQDRADASRERVRWMLQRYSRAGDWTKHQGQGARDPDSDLNKVEEEKQSRLHFQCKDKSVDFDFEM